MIAALLLGCGVRPPGPEEPAAPIAVATLWADGVDEGQTVTVEVTVTSGRTLAGDAFYAQDGGDRGGLRVQLEGVLDDWPPEVGAAVRLTGTYLRGASGPVLSLEASDDGEVLEEPGDVVVTPWDASLDLGYGLVSLSDLTVTSGLDPAGRADTDGPVGIGGCFGFGPGWGRSGDLVGILDGDRLCARSADDWSGELDAAPPVLVSIDEALSQPEGTWIHLDDLLLVTPWDRSGRWGMLQDVDGVGLWVDGEAWGLPTITGRGDVGAWEGEIRTDEDGPYLRTWAPPVPGSASRDPRTSAEVTDGAFVEVTVSGLGPADPWGEVPTAQGWVLDDRFRDVSAVGDPDSVRAAVRGSASLAVLEVPGTE